MKSGRLRDVVATQATPVYVFHHHIIMNLIK